MNIRTLFSYFLGIFITFSIILEFNNIYAQSKKEIIEILEIKIDSFNNVVTKSIKMQDSLEVLLQNERNNSSKIIAAKSDELIQLKQTVRGCK